MAVVSGTLTETGASAPVTISGTFSASVSRTATGDMDSAVYLTRSVDQGVTYHRIFRQDGNWVVWSAADGVYILTEPETAHYRVEATNVAEGETITFRVGQ